MLAESELGAFALFRCHQSESSSFVELKCVTHNMTLYLHSNHLNRRTGCHKNNFPHPEQKKQRHTNLQLRTTSHRLVPRKSRNQGEDSEVVDSAAVEDSEVVEDSAADLGVPHTSPQTSSRRTRTPNPYR